MKTQQRHSSKALLFLATLTLLAVQTSAFAQSGKAARIDKLMTTAHDYGQFNGSVLVAENGRVIYKKGLGLANMEWNIANAPDTKFRLGSITKQFTSMLVMQLVEQGKIKLDGKLSDYLPDYRKDVGERVTIHQLLTHTSGIPNYTALPSFMETISRNPSTVDAFIKKYGSGDLEFEPGTKFNYDNTGYFLLGAIIEKVTGKPYEQVLKENILDPVGMKNTGYDHADTLISKRASGYAKSPSGYVNAAYLDMSLPYAAGSLYSTVEDLYLWDQALYTDKLISAKSKELMFKPNLNNYAYGWFVGKATLGDTKETVPMISHDGGINGFNTAIIRLPANKHLIVLLDNTSGGRYLDSLGQAITNILYDKPFNLPKRSIGEEMLKTIAAQGVEPATKQYREMKASQSSIYNFSEQELNVAGYELLRMGKTKEAIDIFKLNVEAFPQSFNTYGSLGEAYMKNGDKELAIQNYKKSLELNPQNTGATRALAQLNNAPANAEKSGEIKIDPKIFDAYVGDYELAPNFILTVTREGDHLMTQASGQPKVEIYPSSETEFFLKVVDAQVTFVKNEQGQVTQLILHQGGQNIPAKKIK